MWWWEARWVWRSSRAPGCRRMRPATDLPDCQNSLYSTPSCGVSGCQAMASAAVGVTRVATMPVSGPSMVLMASWCAQGGGDDEGRKSPGRRLPAPGCRAPSAVVDGEELDHRAALLVGRLEVDA